MDPDEDAKPNLMALDMSANSSVRSEYLNPFDPAAPVTQAQAGQKPPIKRRAPIACRSVFPQRGQPDHDREYRHPRLRAEKAAKREAEKARRNASSEASIPRGPGAPAPRKPADEWDLLPPLPEIIDAVHVFTRKYFQLGFIPKELFPLQLQRDHRSVSVFLLLGILSISARFSPALTERYQGEMKAVDFFMERASNLALNELYQEPTLERCQAFYLLSLAQQGSGWRNRSYINIGIATRMAVLMHLHREEFYKMKNPTREMIIRAESARRTLWMLHSQDNLHCGALSPVSLAANDITALLPSNEDDFATGREPYSRAALEDTPPARENPALIHQPARSLFASLIQAHYYWGKVARRAMATMKSAKPWDPASEYAITANQLLHWEQQLPSDHRWSMVLLKGHKTVGEDLAYLGVTMITKLCNIVLRRAYLDNIIKTDDKDPQRRAFFSQMSDDLFRNVRDLYEQVDAQFSVRSSEEGVGAQMASFCVYSCGLFSTYLVKYKNICSDKSIVTQAPNMLQRCMSILIESKQTWPLASRWLESLERFSRDPKAAALSLEGSMADGNDRTLRPLHPSPSNFTKPRAEVPKYQLPGPPPTPLNESKPPPLRHGSTSSNTSNILPPPSPSPSLQQHQHQQQANSPLPLPPLINTSQQHQFHHHQQQQQQHSHQQHQNQHHLQPFSPHQQQHHPHQQLQQMQQHQQHQQSRQHTQTQHQHQQHLQQIPPELQQFSPPLYAQAPPPYSPNNGMGMLVQAAAFDTTNPAVGSPTNPYDPAAAAAVAAFYSSPGSASITLGPGTDGFECELQSWFDGSAPVQATSWIGNGAAGLGWFEST
ncbi:putative transcriptional regulatory protein [Colletotrichum spinosum]|uniref:Putative transcriptional regulatory protein n=1 Tax=Colletotrichum spinosum TaxID=1347390 RepID=A0A4R8QVF9_9PEZI|nr:putative transcriptional regulatory protein [Colletotrichum spinosum]